MIGDVSINTVFIMQAITLGVSLSLWIGVRYIISSMKKEIRKKK